MSVWETKSERVRERRKERKGMSNSVWEIEREEREREKKEEGEERNECIWDRERGEWERKRKEEGEEREIIVKRVHIEHILMTKRERRNTNINRARQNEKESKKSQCVWT